MDTYHLLHEVLMPSFFQAFCRVAAGVALAAAATAIEACRADATTAPDDAVLALHRLARIRLPALAESFGADGGAYESWLDE